MEALVINVSDSAAPPGIYLQAGKPVKGDLVLMRDEMKVMAGEPGDVVQWTSDGVYVNDRLLNGSRIPTGSPYPPYPYQTITLKPGQYLFMGKNPLSWDSRYVGPMPQVLIRAKVKQAWAF